MSRLFVQCELRLECERRDMFNAICQNDARIFLGNSPWEIAVPY